MARQGKIHPVDANGRPLTVGDLVRILAVPDLSGMSVKCRAQSTPVFDHLVGTRKRIREFDEFGSAWFSFTIRVGDSKVWHSVSVEPHLLAKVVSRVQT